MKHVVTLLALTLAGSLSAGIAQPADTVFTGQSDVAVTGVVTDAATSQPLAQVQVTTGLGAGAVVAATGFDGTYRLALTGESWVGREITIRFSAIGYAAHEERLELRAGVNELNVGLSPSPIALDSLRVVSTRLRAAESRVVVAATTFDRATPMAGLRVSGRARPAGDSPIRFTDADFNTESYDHLVENPFLSATSNPLSTFSIDVDRASYSNVRRFIREGNRPPVDAIRIEELINYFPYDDPEPRRGEPFSITTEVAPAPWQPSHHLVRIGLRARSVDVEDLPPNNLVFLLDVSGSMRPANKLPLLKTAMRMLVDQLRPQDRVAVVVYAGAAGLALESTPGNQKDQILDAIEGLDAGGSTAGGAGIRLAYQVAADNYIEGGNNRVILATDGDFNVGASSDSEMVRLIEEKRAHGTFLTVLGFGVGNLKDSKMEQLADHGNGSFAYIDSALEAKKVLVNEIGGTLLTVAKDVKLQIEFNPTKVAAYRLIGYENRLLAAEDFDDDTKDAGELGAGHSVTALYELVPVGVEGTVDVREVDELRYQSPVDTSVSDDSEEVLFVKLRFKAPDSTTSSLVERPLASAIQSSASNELRFASAVAAWGMLLRGSEHVGDFTLDDVLDLARASTGEDAEGYRAEFIRLVRATRTLGLVAQSER